MKYRVRDEKGTIHEIDGPDDATPDEIEGAAAAMLGGSQTLRTFRPGDPIPGTKSPVRKGGTGGGLAKAPTPAMAAQPSYSPTDGMSAGELVRAGIGEAITNAGRGVAGALPGVDNTEEVRDARRRDAALNDTTPGMVGNTAGTVGTMLLPGAAVKGLAVGARAAGAAQTADKLGLVGGTLLAPRGVLPAIGVGGATGALQPAESTSERVLNAGMGAAGAGAIPVVSRAYKAGMSALEPFYDGGRDAIVGRTLNRAAGSDAPEVVRRLEAAQVPFVGPQTGVPRGTMGELVPGSIPTTAQIAQNPGISKLERAATAVNPEAGNVVAARLEGQQTARRDVIQGIAGTEADQADAIAAREAASHPAYDQAFTAPLDPQRVAQVQPLFDKLSANPWIQDAVPGARKLAAGDGVALDAGSVQGMHYLKLALDDAIAKGSGATSALGRNQLRQMTQAQQDLVHAMTQVSPEYDSARAWHMTLSQPINQQKVGQAIADRSIDPITNNVRPGNFARALDDSTARRATGFSGATIENTVGPENANRLQMILQDLQRSDKATRAGTGVGSNTVQNMAYANMMEQSGLPSWLTHFSPLQMAGNLASRAGDLAYGKANNRLSALLADALTDPETVARLMRKTGPYADNGLAEILRLGMQPAMTTLPAAINANQ